MFGDRLKALRNEKDMTQQQMVDAIIARLIERGYSKEDAALSLGTYRNWEQNVSIANSKYLAVIAPMLETTSDYLLGIGTDNEDDALEGDITGNYFDKGTRAIARAIAADRDLALLFDAARSSSPEVIRLAHEMLKTMKRKEVGDGEDIDQTRHPDDADGEPVGTPG